jgi:peptidoglycan LD-endopeptidase LytH
MIRRPRLAAAATVAVLALLLFGIRRIGRPSVPAVTVFSAQNAGRAPATERSPRTGTPSPAPTPPDDVAQLTSRGLLIPVAGYDPRNLRDDFFERRGGGGRGHEAIDLLSPRNTPVLAAAEGTIVKLFTSIPGGLTIYEFDPPGRYCYYYAHLEAYDPALHEGERVARGQRIGFVGTSGNAPKNTPHLHFAIFKLGAEKRWWEGTPIDPYPFLAGKV